MIGVIENTSHSTATMSGSPLSCWCWNEEATACTIRHYPGRLQTKAAVLGETCIVHWISWRIFWDHAFYTLSVITHKLNFPDTCSYEHFSYIGICNSWTKFVCTFQLHSVEFQALIKLLVYKDELSVLSCFILGERAPDVVWNIIDNMSYLE